MSIKIGNIDVSYFKVGGDDCSIYLGDALLYPTTPPTPTGSTCYEVINDPITAYTATTYDSVYSFADSKWYMKNNLNTYEEYGIYDTANTLSDLTYYEGKLAGVGTTEYQYSGGTWVSAGTYVNTETTYDVPSGYSTTYRGQTMLTTFKISVADMNVLGTKAINIYDNTHKSYYLDIRKTRYRYNDDTIITGRVTSDSDYYYFTLTDAKPSIEIYRTRGYNGTVHIITEEKNISVEYNEKDMPLAKAYQSIAAMEAEVCPTVGVGQYGVVGSDVYQFDSTELWVTAGDHYKVMERSANAANVVGCNSSSVLTTGDTKPSYFNNSGITEAIIGDCTTSIGASAFMNCKSLTNIDISSGVTSISSYAFYNCSGLANVDIPSAVTSIGDSAFYGCHSLTSVTIPDSVTSIGNHAFDDCTNLPVENNIRYADTYVIEVIDKTLTTYTLKNNTKFIGGNVFQNCSSLTSVTIPDSVTSIGNYVFDGCTSLSNIYIPNSVTSIGVDVFRNCSGLTSVNIPSGVTSIGNSAFNGCTSLTSIDIPSGVTTIGDSAFYGCTSLTSIDIPSGVTTIGDSAFYGCNRLSSINIPSGVTRIRTTLFINCSRLTALTLSDKITYIDYAAFWGCSELQNLTIYATTPPTLGTDVFYNCYSLTIYVPTSSVDTYKAATNWSTWASKIQAIPNS